MIRSTERNENERQGETNRHDPSGAKQDIFLIEAMVVNIF
jgi:hypothetical protein